MKNNYHSILPHRNIFLLTGIFILSLLLRAVHLIQLKSTPLFAFFAGDSSTYHELALEILKGNFLDQASLHLSPLYPFFIAAVYKLTGKGIVAVSLVQIILDSLTCLFLYFISLKIFNKKNLALLSSFI